MNNNIITLKILNMPDNDIQELEVIIYKHKNKNDRVSLITFYNNKIYCSDSEDLTTIETSIKDFSGSCEYHLENYCDEFRICAGTYFYDDPDNNFVHLYIPLRYYSDKHNKIRKYIQENGYFGTRDELYVLK